MSKPAIRYRPRVDATPEAELEVLASVYSFVIQRHENRKTTFSGGCTDYEGGENNQSEAPSGSGGPSATDGSSRRRLR